MLVTIVWVLYLGSFVDDNLARRLILRLSVELPELAIKIVLLVGEL